jgi:endonuclease/exonuclease/phosphatase family metal-dependent hydrolase
LNIGGKLYVAKNSSGPYGLHHRFHIGSAAIPATILLALCFALSCSEDSAVGPENKPPVVEILAGPSGVTEESSVTFRWAGQDEDGEVFRYRFDLNNANPLIRTQATQHTYKNLSNGQYTFYVRAEDDDGAVSEAAQRSFVVAASHLVMPRGEDETLEIAAWNIENFPLRGQTTVDLVTAIIRDLEIDIFAVQEIGDTSAFRQVVRSLDGYAGRYSSDTYGTWYQKTGVIYRKAVVTVSNLKQLYADDSYAFPRPPIEVEVTASHNGKIFDFKLIVLHLKASGGSTNTDRRRRACQLLRQYMDSQIAGSQEKDFIVAGDWNDELDDRPEQNAFNAFIDNPDYEFLTWLLVGDPQSVSYPSSGRLIDHILVSEDALDEHYQGSVTTLRLDDELSTYLSQVSDHRPVMAKFPVFR